MEEKRISDNASCFLIKDERLKSYRTSEAIYAYLREEGFNAQKGGYFIEGIDWLYINIYSKVYTKGRVGIGLTNVVGDHAITFDEFKTIYGIFKKYENLRTLVMNYDYKDLETEWADYKNVWQPMIEEEGKSPKDALDFLKSFA